MSPRKRNSIQLLTASPKSIQRFYGKSYYFSTAFLPAYLRQDIYNLYSFFRIPDEIVDNTADKDEEVVRHELLSHKQKWLNVVDGVPCDEPVLLAVADLFRKKNIPFEYADDFFDAMIQDVTKKRYENYEELASYMYGSAAVVGYIMAYVIGFTDPKALLYAKKLGEAMQLTNMLRDIKEDYEERDRIYMPQDEITHFGVVDAIPGGKISKGWKEFMKFQIERTRALYREAEEGILLLDPAGQRAIRMASRLYEAIPDEIEKNDFDVFRERLSVSWLGKSFIASKTLLQEII